MVHILHWSTSHVVKVTIHDYTKDRGLEHNSGIALTKMCVGEDIKLLQAACYSRLFLLEACACLF